MVVVDELVMELVVVVGLVGTTWTEKVITFFGPVSAPAIRV